MDGAGAAARHALLDRLASSQQSVELDILQLSQQWEAQRTICSGNTPGHALHKGARAPLASISANVAAVNPFSFTAQRHKAAGAQQRPHAQQPSVRFALDEQQHEQQAAPAATPPSVLPATLSRIGLGRGGTSSAAGSPSPYVLFRGRLSFVPGEVDSARKFDRPTSAKKAAPPEGVSLKRKLLISPGADISAAFPTLLKPSAKQRRRSVSHAVPSWSARAAQAAVEEEQAASAAAAAPSADQPQSSGQGVYWSEPLPFSHMAGGQTCPGAAAAAADEDMQDTAASPASSSGAGGPCSPSGGGMDACCCCSASPKPAFSPLPGSLQQALPTVENPDCGFPAITARTMRDLLTHGPAAFGLTDFVVVDCRYDFEFAGGHLPGAVHLTTPEALADFLSAPKPRPDYWQHTALIFHCEFSTERGPRAAKHVRNKDREAHMHDYPALSHPHVFVLQGGYKAFWKSFAGLCEGGYVPMDHPECSAQLKVCHNIVKRAWAKTTRTYARKQRQRRPSYRLRASDGPGRGGDAGEGCAMAAAAAAAAADVEEEEEAGVPPAMLAAQHACRGCPL